MLISPAYAQAAGAPAGFEFFSLLPLILIFLVFYFLLIRPQQKRMKEHREMLDAIKKGDKIVTGGGVMANVIKIEEDNVVIVEIAQNVRVKVLRGTIQDVVRDKAEPANANAPKAEGSGEKPGFMAKLLGKK